MVGYEDHYPNGKAVQTTDGSVIGYRDGLNGDTGMTSARSINASGQVVGSSMDAAGHFRAVWFQAHAAAADLGTLGGVESIAYDINDAGVIVGYAKLANGFSHAFSYANGVMTDLDPLNATKQSNANAINASGQIVGYVNRTGQHAALFENGQIIDLNDMVDLVSGGFVSLTYALDINDLGQIVGYGETMGRQTHAFLLTPVSAVPEPSTLAAWIGGAALLGSIGRRWRQRMAA
jgi:probable HAF family extracellular repeat protein